MVVKGQIRLTFDASGVDVTDLSAVCQDGSWLWLARDEGTKIERLTADNSDDELSYANQRTFALGDFVTLPAGPDEEIDIEGLDCQGEYIWLTGSHSRTRKRVEPDDDDQRAVKNLGKV